VGFSRALVPALQQVEGDQGARAVLRAHQASLWQIPCEDIGIFQDIDTPADLV
jgi:molybdenum cofactor cytidylyltransferase